MFIRKLESQWSLFAVAFYFSLLWSSIAYAGDNREAILRKEVELDKYEAAVKQNPSSFEALKNLADCYSGIMKASEIMPKGYGLRKKYKRLYDNVIKKIDENAPNDYEYYFWKARNSMTSADNYKASIDAIDKAIQLAPDKPELYYWKSSYLSGRNDWDGVIDADKKFLQLVEDLPADNPLRQGINIPRAVLINFLHCKGRESEIAEILSKMQNENKAGSFSTILQWYHVYKNSLNEVFKPIFEKLVNDPSLNSIERENITSKSWEEMAVRSANITCERYKIK